MTAAADQYLEAVKLAANYKEAIVAAEEMPADTMQQAEERMIACSNARSLLDKALVHGVLAVAAALGGAPEPAVAPLAGDGLG